MKDYSILVSDASSLFANVLLDETIQILGDKAFEKDWFNNSIHQLNISKSNHIKLLKLATKNQLLEFLWEAVQGSWTTYANDFIDFMLSIKEKI